MRLRITAILAAIFVWSIVAFAQTTATPPALGYIDSFQVNYTSDPAVGTFVNMVNAGTQGGLSPAGDVCANVYVYDPDEQPRNCCACRLTPNATKSLSGVDLSPPGFSSQPPSPGSFMVKIVATLPTGAATTANPNAGCNASSVPTGNGVAGGFAAGLRTWATHWHTSPFGFGTETESLYAPLSGSELAKLTGVCAFFQTFGTGAGICASCRTGADAPPTTSISSSAK